MSSASRSTRATLLRLSMCVCVYVCVVRVCAFVRACLQLQSGHITSGASLWLTRREAGGSQAKSSAHERRGVINSFAIKCSRAQGRVVALDDAQVGGGERAGVQQLLGHLGISKGGRV